MRRTLDPKLDVVFKILFAHPGSRGCLTSVLTAVLRPVSPIVEVEVLNPEIPGQEAFEKGVVLDLRVRLAGGSQVDVEMQSDRQPGSRKRMLYYWAKMYGAQLGRGAEYASLEPVVVVVFTDYRELESERLHSTFRILEVTHHEDLCDDLEIHLIELPKLDTMRPAELEAERLLVAWARFLAARTDEEVEAAAKEDEMIEQAKDMLERVSEDPKVRELASWREAHLALDRMQRRMGLEEARAEGRTEGLAEGRAKGRAEGKRDVLLMVLEQRGITLSESQRVVIEACDDLSRLDTWIRRAVAGSSADDILA